VSPEAEAEADAEAKAEAEDQYDPDKSRKLVHVGTIVPIAKVSAFGSYLGLVAIGMDR
jgi:hypothetical protein